MTEYLPPELGVAQQFIRLITTKWSEVGDDLSMELRALGQHPQSIRFNSKKEEEVVAVLLVCRTLAPSAPSCFGTTSFTWPVRPEPPFGADGNVIFRYHLGAPNSEVISYRNFCRTTRGAPASARTTFVGCGGTQPPLRETEFTGNVTPTQLRIVSV